MAKKAKRQNAARGRKSRQPRTPAAGRKRNSAQTRASSAKARPSGARAARSAQAPKPDRSRTTRSARVRVKGRKPEAGSAKAPRLDRARRRLEDIIPTPPSSLNLNRHGSAARTGRAELAEALADHASMTPAITGGDVDADLETAYFSGDEAPGGDNPTPDQEIVEEIGRALGIEYQDNEELRGSDKVADRDRHRWELDPASSEDYRDRKK